MPDSLPPETLAWLRHAASCGQRDAQLTLHILERLEALEQRPIPGTVELAAPTPEAAPVATDEELNGLFKGTGMTWQQALRAAYDFGRQHAPAAEAQPAPPTAPAGGLVKRVAEKMGPQLQAAMDAGELPYGAARAAIREVAADARSKDLNGQSIAVMTWESVAQWLEQEADR